MMIHIIPTLLFKILLKWKIHQKKNQWLEKLLFHNRDLNTGWKSDSKAEYTHKVCRFRYRTDGATSYESKSGLQQNRTRSNAFFARATDVILSPRPMTRVDVTHRDVVICVSTTIVLAPIYKPTRIATRYI